MAKSMETFTEFVRLLDDVEDLLSGGWRRPVEKATNAVAGTWLLDPVERDRQLRELDETVAVCSNCGLRTARAHAVPGAGMHRPLLLAVGDSPGADEDARGLPFVGEAGRYLDKWLEAVGMCRNADCYLTTLVKCRPPHDREPSHEEAATCIAYLERQVALLRPRVILCLGGFAARYLVENARVSRLRGSVHRYRGVDVYVTYHPTAVLNDPALRKAVWDDLRAVRARIGAGTSK
jgi:DNA polymerase